MILFFVALSGCSVQAERTFDGVVSASEVTVVQVSNENGSLSMAGVSDNIIRWSGVSVARGSNEEKAIEHEATNAVVPSFVDSAFHLHSQVEGGALALEVTAPSLMDIFAETSGGNLSITDFEGIIEGQGKDVTASGLVGDVALTSKGRMDVAVRPGFTSFDPDTQEAVDNPGVITLTAGGDTVLRVPADGDYDLQVTISAEHGPPEIEDFGFDAGFTLDASGFSGTTGDASTIVSVTVLSGSFTLKSLVE